jgi:hypothetical protein
VKAIAWIVVALFELIVGALVFANNFVAAENIVDTYFFFFPSGVNDHVCAPRWRWRCSDCSTT